MRESSQRRAHSLETDPATLLEVAGGLSAVSVALAFWVHERELGPRVDGFPMLVPAFLLAGLAALFASSCAFGLLLERELSSHVVNTSSLTFNLLLFLSLTLIILIGAYIAFLFFLAP